MKSKTFRNKTFTVQFGILVGTLVVVVPSALAAEKDVELRNTVVTATKTEMELSDAPAAVTVVTSKDISERNVSRVTDALATVPGLFLGAPMNGQMSQGTGAGNFTLRGMDASRTGVLVDGQSITDSFSNKVDFRTILTDDVERIEVVPGAFSSLYGSSAIGGVINIITKQPTKQEMTVRIKKGFGDAAGEDLNVYFRNKLENGLGIVAGFGHQDRDGYVNEFVVRSPVTGAAGTVVTGAIPTTTTTGLPAYIVGDKGKVPWRQTNATVKLSYDLSPRNKLYGGVAYNDYKAGQGSYNTYLRNAAGNPVSSGTLGIDGKKVTLTESTFANSSPLVQGDLRYHGGFEGVIGQDYKLKLELSKNIKTSWYNAVGTGTFSGGNGTYNNSPSDATEGLAQLSFPLGATQFLVTGVTVRRERLLNKERWTLSNWRDTDSKTALIDGSSGEATIVSLFAQDEITVSDALKLYVGGRFDKWTTEGSNFRIGAGAYNNTFASRSETAFSPKLSAVFKAAKDVTLRASVGQSFRAPNNYELYGSLYCCSTYYYSNPNLKPETATTWEVGGDWMPTDKLKTTVSVYQTTLKDMIYSKTLTTMTAPATVFDKDRINAGEARVKGIELSGSSKLTRWLDLNIAYSYIDSAMLKNNADPLTIGKRLANTPKNLMTIGWNAHYGPWTGLLESKYTGQTYTSERNTDTVEGVPGSRGHFTMTNAKIGYQINKTAKASLAINNLTDAKVYQYYLLPGRNATAEVAMSF
jgi:iron complex outermembrane receptor protein